MPGPEISHGILVTMVYNARNTVSPSQSHKEVIVPGIQSLKHELYYV
jgi:hypothetical protein